MKKQKKISVIVPCYNVEKYIGQCIESLKNQTYKDIEVIIINDGSTDNTLNVIKKTVVDDDRFKVIDQRNHGIGSTRNKGIALASGYYITFVDSDDYVEANMYEDMIATLEKNNSDIVVCDYYKFNSKKRQEMRCGVNVKFNLSVFDSPKIINNVGYCPWNKVYKTELFKKIKFPTDKKFEDLSTVIKVFSKANKISKIDSCLYDYRINENGETCTINKRDLDILFIIKDVVSYLQKDKNYAKIESEIELLSILQLQKGLLSAFKICNIKETLNYIDEVFDFLNNNFQYWRKNKIFDSEKFITKFIKHHKNIYKIFAILKITKRSISK